MKKDTLHTSEVYFKRAKDFHFAGDLDKAISQYKKAVTLNPKNERILNNLGVAYKQKNEFKTAVSYYKKALKINPKFTDAINNLGNAYKSQGKFEASEKEYKKAIKIDPTSAFAYNNLGTLYNDLGRNEEALKSYTKALEYDPQNPNVLSNLGAIYISLSKYDEAKKALNRAQRLRPDVPYTLRNLGIASELSAEYDSAFEYYKKALTLEPLSQDILKSVITIGKNLCEWEFVDEYAKQLNVLTSDSISRKERPGETPYLTMTHYDNPVRNLRVATAWSDSTSKYIKDFPKFQHSLARFKGKKLRIGYLSADFRDHAMAHVMTSLFGHHNKKNFEIYCYSYGNDDKSMFRREIEKGSDKFTDVKDMSDYDAAKTIYKDKINILVDLMGWTSNSRPTISALRPAPVQVMYLGQTGTTGSKFIDYIIADKIIIPPKQRKDYSEKVVYMPHCYQVNTPYAIYEKKLSRKKLYLPEKGIVFCSFNRTYKITKEMFDTWMNILAKVPNSVLWLFISSKKSIRNLKIAAMKKGVDKNRLIFAYMQKLDDHLNRLKYADIALDTHPYSGGSTTNNALWAGLPVITYPGKSYTSRMSASIMTAIGAPELIVKDLTSYESLAVELATNKDKLKKIHKKLEKNIKTHPAFDVLRFVSNLEKGYEIMWNRYVYGKKPKHIIIKEHE